MSEQQVFRGLETPAKRQRTAARLRELRRERDGWAKGMIRESFRHAVAIRQRDEAIRQRDELRRDVERLSRIVVQGAEWLEMISSADGSGHADLGRALRRLLAGEIRLNEDRAPAPPEATE